MGNMGSQRQTNPGLPDAPSVYVKVGNRKSPASSLQNLTEQTEVSVSLQYQEVLIS